ncbi:hypothetical protein ANN_07571 [Periplaneta americana]|uniref:Uncharacterized protein n=1 Tax=Periplaneta americana TaxID=6978 RepID=A0ABQ8T0K5_PERAM|nr:hypothetical protein ANN_07571 [Periplaneta americana]
MAGLCEGGNEPLGSLKPPYWLNDRLPLLRHVDVKSVVDFYLWGALKDTVYATKPQTLEELRAQIEHSCNDIPLATIQLNDFHLNICERIPNLTGEQSDGIKVFRIPPMTSLMLHRCRTSAINLQRWWQSPSVNLIGSCIGRELADE